MAGFLRRTLVTLAGVVLGMATVAGLGPLHRALGRSGASRPPSSPAAPGERAPDNRV